MLKESMMKALYANRILRKQERGMAKLPVSKLIRRVWRRYWSFMLLFGLVIGLAVVVPGMASAALTVDMETVVPLSRVAQEEIEPIIVVQLIPEYEWDSGSGIAEEQAVSLDIPDVDTSVKTFMSYKAITDRSSIQWKLQQKAVTNAYGFREIDGKYLIALGTYYSDHAGAMFRITLENGTVFDAIMGDVKDNRDTDSKNQHRNGNVVEFIVDTPKLAEDARLMGDVSYTPGAGLMGPVQSIEYLGEYEF